MLRNLLTVLSSLRITVSCLLLLFILVFWGTVYQVQHGLYLAQKHFFESFAFWIIRGIPFPGGQLVLWVLFLNLLCAVFTRFKFNRHKTGIALVHAGVFLFFISGFITFQLCQETHLTLAEGDGSNLSESNQDWELAVWKTGTQEKEVTAYDTEHLKRGYPLDFSEFGFRLVPQVYYPNADKTGSSLNSLKQEKEPERNLPGGLFSLPETGQTLLLHGGDDSPALIEIKEDQYAVSLRRKRLPLPFFLQLNDFRMEVHPGTAVARSYQSEVSVFSHGQPRTTVISMNEPLREKDFTFYQASYAIDPAGREISTLAVVKNAGRLLPYIATFVLVLGLAVHTLLVASRISAPEVTG